MLYLYQSNRLEDLAELLQAVKTRQPLRHLLASEEIIVQSQGMRRFLSRHLARETGIAANLKFSLPAGLAWRLMRDTLPDIPALNPFSPEVMRWRLLGLFSDRHFHHAPEFALSRAALGAYLQRGGNAAYQLAGQMADIFDQYLIYRADWLDAWQAGKTLGLGGDEAWQAELWRFLDNGSQTAPHRAALWQQFLGALDKAKLPERFFVFGIATLAPLYLELLQALSRHCDIHVFALNPSSEYWGNIIEPAQILKSGADIDLSQSGHPLLASLGKQGRDFFDALIEAGAQTELAVYSDAAASESLLHRLQHDIQTLSLPAAAETPSEPDGSIRIVSAHSPLRELQILKDHILRVLNEHPSWQPHDIAVLTPNIEPYSPYIEAVFGRQTGGGQALPYSVSDVKLSRRQPLLHALKQTLELLESRFETNKVLPLLENETVLRRFGLSRQDLPLLHETVTQLNIHWGMSDDMRGGKDTLFTWQQGLDRLVLGWMMPGNTGTLWQNISALPGNLNLLEPLSRFAAFIRTLATIRRNWQQEADVPEWTQRLRHLMAHLLQSESGDQHAVQQIEQALAQWQEEAALAGFRQALSQHTAIRHITRFLESRSEAGFLRSGITFCSMVPMRSLPFKMLCLIGLNDTDFPRNTRASGFDLIARHPRKGDRARRDDDRYLLLEALMSAREILYLSYQGRSIQNNDLLAPSALLPELIDTLSAMTGLPPEQLSEQMIENHPLQAFSPQYFVSGRHYTSSRSDYAEALNRPQKPVQPFFSRPLTEPETAGTVSQGRLIQFWRNPVRAWLQQSLNWREPYIDEAWDSAEPFTPEHSSRITAEYTAARRHNQDFNRTAERLAAESMLPAGELGKLWRNEFEAKAKSLDTALVQSPKLPAVPYTLTLGKHTLEGSLGKLYRHGLIDFQNEQPNAPRRIELMLEHLIFNAVRPDSTESFQSHWLLPGNPTILPEIPQEKAQSLLTLWLDYYVLGQTRPLPFFPKTNLAAAEAWLNPGKDDPADKAKKAAYTAYNGSKMSTGQREYTEVDLVFGSADEAPPEQQLFWALTEQMLVPTLSACPRLQENEGNKTETEAE
ncbi:exodeoxyribonuclease V subunit gamma [Neisseria wadsworthii]|uniref:exodeoxyribonuclease V subunit gamma n=1 Tax=Neisseria wadsworthii TaxID=607711 RepID=UPI000D2F8289|nr:exodeoxyribonuclease V subunit gamma [Neisseria wadsworthii]